MSSNPFGNPLESTNWIDEADTTSKETSSAGVTPKQDANPASVTNSTLPIRIARAWSVLKEIRSAEELDFHLLSNRIASSADERTFSTFLRWYGLPTAVVPASKLHLQFQRPFYTETFQQHTFSPLPNFLDAAAGKRETLWGEFPGAAFFLADMVGVFRLRARPSRGYRFSPGAPLNMTGRRVWQVRENRREKQRN
ncbi:MAG TPA: hypothetical protein VK699_00200 [Terriglobales bacterium]|jgi:hypothetical protein|nr:hypothetical protein [Terriglobales bacterium]